MQSAQLGGVGFEPTIFFRRIAGTVFMYQDTELFVGLEPTKNFLQNKILLSI